MKVIPSILLAEDDPDDRDLTHRALRSTDTAADIHDVADGHRAMHFLRAAADGGEALPGLLLLDLRMPKQDGFGVLAELRADHRLRNIPVVVLSTSNNPTDVDRCYSLGANSYVTKPLGVRRFNEMIQTLLTYWFGVVQLPLDSPADA